MKVSRKVRKEGNKANKTTRKKRMATRRLKDGN
jgi:hypothetical protein